MSAGASSRDTQETKRPTPPKAYTVNTPIDHVHYYQGRSWLYGNQYAQVGTQVDMWADLIPGQGDQGAKFYFEFLNQLKARQIVDIQTERKKLTATGWFAPKRNMEFTQRGAVSVTTYIANQGTDLYISWRVFLSGTISWIKVFLVAVLGFFIYTGTLFGIYSLDRPLYAIERAFMSLTVHFQVSEFLIFGGCVLTAFFLVYLFGTLFRKGDGWALLRKPINELQVDEVISLGLAVHQSVMTALDQVGIDSTTLRHYEPFYTQRNRRI